jgi:hypothetical protein
MCAGVGVGVSVDVGWLGCRCGYGCGCGRWYVCVSVLYVDLRLSLQRWLYICFLPLVFFNPSRFVRIRLSCSGGCTFLGTC